MKKKSFVLGYSLVVHSFIAWLCMGFLMVTLSNVVFPNFVAAYGWNSTLLSTLNTVGGITGSLCGILIGQWVDAKGPKQVLVVGFVVGGVNFVLMGLCKTLPLFGISLIAAHICAQAFCQMTTNNLIARWFIHKKGAVLGITTAGLPCATALMVPLTTKLAAAYSITFALAVVGIAMIVIGLISIVWVKNSPEEVGLTPDNMPISEGYKPPVLKKLTFGMIAKKKETWQFIVIFGFMFCATIASSSQLVAYCIQRGYDAPGAVKIVSFSAVCGIVGSFLFGLIDQFAGTKKATIIYCIIAIVTYGGMFVAGKSAVLPLAIISFMINGAPGNLLPSMLMSKFEVEEFNSIFKLIMPIVSVLRSCGFFFAAMCILIFKGNYGGVYAGLCVLIIISLILTCFVNLKEKTSFEG